MAPIKVCFVLLRTYAVFRPELKERFGGAEVQFYMLSRELAKDPGFEVTCVSRDFGQPNGEVIDGVRHFKIAQGWAPLRHIQAIRYIASGVSLYRMLGLVGADVYLQFCAGVETGIVALYCRRANKVPVHFIASDSELDGRFEKQSAPWVRVPFLRGMRQIPNVICQNDYQQRHLLERFGRDGPIMPSLCEIPGEYAVPQARNVLWVSRVVPMKRPEMFFDLARACPEQRFVMVAARGADPDYFEKTTATARSIPNLKLLESVPYQEMDRHYADARVLVNTSTFEGFPNTFLEAMKYGVPVLSASVNPNGVLTDGQSGLVAGDGADALVAGLRRLLDDAETYASRSRGAYDYVAGRHDSRTITERYKQMFRELMQV